MSETKSHHTTRGKLSRRQFLRRTAGLTAAATGFPMIIPGSALGLGGATAPSNRIVMGCIGVGSQGTGNLEGFLKFPEVQVVGVADVDANHRARAKKMIDGTYDNTDCAEYNDFRELIAREDLQALSLALPDHWHSIPVIEAARRKLDMYAEKPLALTIAEGRAMVTAVKANKVVWQTGSWQRSRPHFRQACEVVRNGRIGEVHTIKVGLPTGSGCDTVKEMPVPAGFDYNRWLGPAPDAPYTELRCHWNFRWILDYSGGQLTDWGAHHCDIANWAMGTERTGPIEIEGTGIFPRSGLWNAATDYYVICRFAPGASPVAPKGFNMILSNSFPNGARFEGANGSVFVDRGGWQTDPENLKDTVIGENEVHLYASDNHAGNFLDCVRSRKETITPIEAAHYAINNAHLGNVAMRLGRKVRWDPVKERFINDPIADRLLSRAMRAPWTI